MRKAVHSDPDPEAASQAAPSPVTAFPPGKAECWGSKGWLQLPTASQSRVCCLSCDCQARDRSENPSGVNRMDSVVGRAPAPPAQPQHPPQAHRHQAPATPGKGKDPGFQLIPLPSPGSGCRPPGAPLQNSAHTRHTLLRPWGCSKAEGNHSRGPLYVGEQRQEPLSLKSPVAWNGGGGTHSAAKPKRFQPASHQGWASMF